MDISPVWRKVCFAVIVCALAGLGAYLLSPAAHGAGSSGPGHPATSGTGAPRPTASPGGAGGGGAASQPGAGGTDIYQWLPFTQQGLAAAAADVVRFGDAYGTYSYTESAGSYIATLQPVASQQLTQQIEAAFTAPGVAAARTSGKQVAVGTATIESIRAFGPTSLTFIVQVSQQLTDTTGRSQLTTVYAVTLTGTGTNWQASSIELASAGNT
jgi:hypothetical protein